MTYSRQMNQHTISPINILICLLGLISIAFTVFIRAIPQSLNGATLMALNTNSLFLSDIANHFQYYTLVMLLVAGIVTDFVGPRIVLPIALAVAMVGNCIFCTAVIQKSILHGRMMIMFAHPFIFIGALNLGSQWLPKRHFTFYVGLLFATLLYVPTDNPLLAQIVSLDTLQNIMIGSNVVAGLLIVGFVLSMNAKKPFVPRTTFGEIGGTLMQYRIWVLALISLAGWLANTFLLNFGDFFLQHNFHYPIPDAQMTINVVFICFASGAVLMGLFADNMEHKQALIFAGYILAALCFLVALFLPPAWFAPVSGLLFLTGFFASAAIISYAKAFDVCVLGTAGLTFSIIAAITTLGNIIGGKLIGTWINSYSPAALTIPKLQMILLVLPATLLIGALLTFTLTTRIERNRF